MPERQKTSCSKPLIIIKSGWKSDGPEPSQILRELEQAVFHDGWSRDHGLGYGPSSGRRSRTIPSPQATASAADGLSRVRLRLLRSGEVSLGIYLRRFHVTVPQDGGCDVESKLVPDAGRGCVAQAIRTPAMPLLPSFKLSELHFGKV